MTPEERAAQARQSWINAKSSRLAGEGRLGVLKDELAQAEALVKQQEMLNAAAVARENAAHEFYRAAEKECTEEAKAAEAARELAEAAQGLQDRLEAARRLKQEAEKQLAVAQAAVVAFAEQPSARGKRK